MAEESKVDYVQDGFTPGGTTTTTPSIIPSIDPTLSQEEQDLRLAMALQQEENANAYSATVKRHQASASSQTNRTTRSNVGTSLGAIRKAQKANEGKAGIGGAGAHGSSGAYYAPSGGASAQEVADARLAGDMQKVEQATAGTARMMAKIQMEEESARLAAEKRNARSGTGAFKK